MISGESVVPSGQEPTRPGMKWYVLRVASNKEEQVRESLERKVRIEGLGDRIGRILVPTAKEKRMKAGQVKVFEKKLYPGYVFVEMATEPDGSIAENVWFLVKETMGVGDFIGSDGKPDRLYTMSSGKPSTPTVLGSYRVYMREPGTNSHGMVYSSYFIRGYAIHGYYEVPPYPASHGCLRVPVPDAVPIWNWIGGTGVPVDVYYR